MLRLTILDQTGQSLFEDVIGEGLHVIGRDSGADIALSHPSVSPRHARVRVYTDRVTVCDLASFSGTLLGGRRIPKQREVVWREGQEVRICDFRLRYVSEGDESAADQGEEAAEADGSAQVSAPGTQTSRPAESEKEDTTRKISVVPGAAPAVRPPLSDRARLLDEILSGFYSRMDLRRLEAQGLDDQGVRKQVLDTLAKLLREHSGQLPASEDELLRELEASVLGLGPLEELLADKTVDEVMVNGPFQIYVERQGRLVITDKQFRDNEHVMRVIERIVASKGRRIDEQQPYVDTRLDDGSRVHAIIPPLALGGPTLTIRKFPERHLTIQDLVKFGSVTVAAAKMLRLAVKYRNNIVVSGGTGSGKTTLLNVLSSFLPENERIVTIEDAAELRLTQPHVVRLESRPPNIEGTGAVTIRDLVRNSLRMRPDRIVVGECRGGEALDMLQAMNTGHDGSLTTVHANSPRDALSRLETLCLMSGMELPARAIREQICSAVSLVVQQTRFSTGERKVVSITEVTGMEEGVITAQEIFEFQRRGLDSEGKIIGGMVPTGVVPSFVDKLVESGIPVPMEIFDPDKASS